MISKLFTSKFFEYTFVTFLTYHSLDVGQEINVAPGKFDKKNKKMCNLMLKNKQT